jgi:isopenicillin N synthase-like dioxygenase
MEAPESEVIPQVIEMFSTIGFLHIRNVKGHDEDELLEACKAFHAIPESEKKKLYLHHHN